MLVALLLSCAPAGVPPEVEARFTALEARIAAQDARMDALMGWTTTTDATGRVTTTLSEGAAVVCAKANLEGLVSAQLAYEAAFDTFGDSFEQIGWHPGHQGDCAAHVVFSMEPLAMRLVPDDRAPKVPLGVAVVVRGHAKGRVFAADREARVYEVARIPDEQLPALLAASEWIGGR